MPVGLAEHHAGQDGRLHDDDVGHREERGNAGQQFRARRGLVFRQAKNSIKHGFCPAKFSGESSRRDRKVAVATMISHW
jgi:hypothetical protein